MQLTNNVGLVRPDDRSRHRMPKTHRSAMVLTWLGSELGIIREMVMRKILVEGQLQGVQARGEPIQVWSSRSEQQPRRDTLCAAI
jgi:hypothetical protein